MPLITGPDIFDLLQGCHKLLFVQEMNDDSFVVFRLLSILDALFNLSMRLHDFIDGVRIEVFAVSFKEVVEVGFKEI
jgi:hypothetical protein